MKQPQVAFKRMVAHIESILGDLEESEPHVQDGGGQNSAADRKAEEGEARKP
jgi:hypothetical protein